MNITSIERDSHTLTAAPGSGPTPDVAALAAPELVRAVITPPAPFRFIPFANLPSFLTEFGQYRAAKEVLDLERYREAQCEGETVKCEFCGITLAASARLDCGTCA